MGIELIFFIYILPIFANLFIADNKGRSSGIWFLLTLILGFIATIILIGLPATEQAIKKREIQNGDLLKCPKCMEYIKKEAKICKHCGQEFE